MSKTPLEELAKLLIAAKAKVRPGTTWQHYKGAVYVVADIVIREEDNALLVLYAPVALPAVSFARPLAAWQDSIALWETQKSRFTQL